jgi:hypothetical protein
VIDSDRTRRTVSRRSALRIGAGAAAAGIVAGLAGCSSVPLLGGGGGSSGSQAMRDWLVEPGELADRNQYAPVYLDYGALLDVEDELDDGLFNAIEDGYETRYEDPFDVDIEDANWGLRLGTPLFRVFSGSYSRTDAVAHLEDEFDFDEQDDRVGGFSIVLGPEELSGVALDGSVILFVNRTEDPADNLEVLIEAQSGEAEMYAEENEAAGAALDAVDGDHLTLTENGPTDDVEALAVAATFDGETTERTAALVFDDEDAVDEDLLDDVEADTEWDEMETSTDGRVGFVEGVQDTDAFAFEGITYREASAVIARQWFQAANEGNTDRVERLTHSDSELRAQLDLIVSQFDSTEFTIDSVETVGTSGEEARVEVTLTDENGETSTSTIVMRLEDGAWRVYAVD